MNKLIALLFLLGSLIVPTGAYGVPNAYRIQVDGLACPFCSYGIEKRIRKIEGVEKIETDVRAGAVTVTMKEGKTLSEEQARQAIREAGFTLGGFEEVPQEQPSQSAGEKRK